MDNFDKELLEELDVIIQEYGAEEFLLSAAEVFRRREDEKAAKVLSELAEDPDG